jgi:subtilisin
MGKVLGDNGEGGLEGIMQGVDWAIQNKFDIISMSLGCDQKPPEMYHKIFQLAAEAGIIIVAASGNENTTVGWPAAYEEILSVGAVDQDEKRAEFSNFGKRLDVVAPGVDILSTYPGNRYAILSGTSMATPMVVGALALLISHMKKENEVLTLEKAKELLGETCLDLGVKGKDKDYGFGLINIATLLNQEEKEDTPK